MYNLFNFLGDLLFPLIAIVYVLSKVKSINRARPYTGHTKASQQHPSYNQNIKEHLQKQAQKMTQDVAKSGLQSAQRSNSAAKQQSAKLFDEKKAPKATNVYGMDTQAELPSAAKTKKQSDKEEDAMIKRRQTEKQKALKKAMIHHEVFSKPKSMR